MRILFASEYYPPWAPGGGEWTNQAWAEALARAGHRVIVVTLNYGGPPRETSAAGVLVIRIPFWARGRPGHEIGARRRRWLAGAFDAYFAWRIRCVAQAERVDVIHPQSKGALVPSSRAARRLGLPVVATIRDVGLLCPLGYCTIFEPWETFDCSKAQFLAKCVPYFEKHYKPDARFLRRGIRQVSLRRAWGQHLERRRTLAGVDGVVGVSAGILACYPESVVPGTRRRVVHSLRPAPGAPKHEDAARLRRELRLGEGPLVLYAGRFSHGKGGEIFADALETIRREVPGVGFVIAGRSEIRLPAAADVHSVGVVPHSTLFSLYRAADVVVVPSIWPEPLSRVIVEAMSFGRPVVASAVGGSPEAIEDGVTGLLVPRKDPAALAEAIIALLRDPARRETMGAAARERAAEIFGEDRVVAALLDAYAAARRNRA